MQGRDSLLITDYKEVADDLLRLARNKQHPLSAHATKLALGRDLQTGALHRTLTREALMHSSALGDIFKLEEGQRTEALALVDEYRSLFRKEGEASVCTSSSPKLFGDIIRATIVSPPKAISSSDTVIGVNEFQRDTLGITDGELKSERAMVEIIDDTTLQIKQVIRAGKSQRALHDFPGVAITNASDIKPDTKVLLRKYVKSGN